MVTKDSKELSESNSLIIKTEAQTCPECGSTRTIHNQECAEIACMDCGFVVQQKSPDLEEPEWKNVDPEQKQNHTRTNTPLTYTIHDKESSTVIDWHNRDTYNENSTVGQKMQVYRLRKWQRRVRISDSTEHNSAFTLSEITKTAHTLNLPKNVLETASAIYQKAAKKRWIRSHSTQSVATAVLYLACRQWELQQTLNEIAQASSADKKEIGKIYRCLIKEADYKTPPLRPKQHKQALNQPHQTTSELSHDSK
jgi:transcription initiation factor TFIIB